jgi:hypothetical protein
MQPENTDVARKWLGKQTAIVEGGVFYGVRSEVLFSLGSVPKLYIRPGPGPATVRCSQPASEDRETSAKQ